ncbi:ABC transporter ATP-binding protein [Methanobrevibacter sp.]|uniref:ABC transporter ATP-binding protein n=1 Tax=Methanobrevibacter sp. TaxID=66852 RepID=UPI0026DF12F5|nr:ABC transporter ATP-binding protein [Methanobrevibacter sp.]MDO5860576.1 ABC transporter ATP-binding protein [Methanobrevibacter sp.]
MTFEIENVSKTFVSNDSEEEVFALKDINLTIETGSFVSFVGPSGCGKTTLLRIIEGFEKPTEGTVKDDGELVTGPSNERGFIFQNYSLYPWLNVIDNVIFGLDINGQPEKESRKRAMKYLESVGLKDFAKRHPHELSGGMKQRVAIIRSIINDSKSLLMDETFSALDVQTKHKLQKQVLDICQENNKTILFVTHDIDEAVFLSDEVIVLSRRPGRIKKIFKIKLEHPRNREDKEFNDLVSEITQEIAKLEDE